MRIHFISIGGAVMHNLALALHQQGHTVSGSDDEIFEPSRSRLKKKGLLPETEGWSEKNISEELDAVILGMHARKDNPELLKAMALGLKVYSFPEFVYEQTKDKKRMVIGGSHGKTTTTAMVMHVLRQNNIAFDYLVGSQLEGFETMVGFDPKAQVAVIEGDEYLTSALDPRPKFHVYQADVGIITGIAWDHINVFPTFENYLEQFVTFAVHLPQSGHLIYFKEDPHLQEIVASGIVQADCKGYSTPDYQVSNGEVTVTTVDGNYTLAIFGKHNLQNMEAARLAVEQVGVSGSDFYQAMSTFKGTAKRLEVIAATETCHVYRDFAHSPSKVSATVKAVNDIHPDRELVACLELHTFSSLNQAFIEQYQGTMDEATIKMVYFNPHTVALKRLEQLDSSLLRRYFGEDAQIYTDASLLKKDLESITWEHKDLLLMSSGNFNNITLTIP